MIPYPIHQTGVQRFTVNAVGRDIAVGDIHGCFSKLERALETAGFSPGRDRLFSVGDLVDRGPESRQVLNWLDRPWFHAICGNHDLMAWRRALGQPLSQVNHLDHGGEWLDSCEPDLRISIAERLRDLPLGMEIETPQGMVGVLHADFPYDDWHALHKATFSVEDVDSCLWSRDRYRMKYKQPIRNIHAVIHGHSTVPKLTQLGNVFYVDTGGWRDGGRFTLLDLHTLKPVG